MADPDSGPSLCGAVSNEKDEVTRNMEDAKDSAEGCRLSPDLGTAKIQSSNQTVPSEDLTPATTHCLNTEHVEEKSADSEVTKAPCEKVEESTFSNTNTKSDECKEKTILDSTASAVDREDKFMVLDEEGPSIPQSCNQSTQDDGCPKEVDTKLKETVSRSGDSSMDTTEETAASEDSFPRNDSIVASIHQIEDSDRMDTKEESTVREDTQTGNDEMAVPVRHETESCDVNIPSSCSLSPSRVSSVEDSVVTACCTHSIAHITNVTVHSNNGDKLSESCREPMDVDEEVHPSRSDQTKNSDVEDTVDGDLPSKKQEISNSDPATVTVNVAEEDKTNLDLSPDLSPDLSNKPQLSTNVVLVENVSQNPTAISGSGLENVGNESELTESGKNCNEVGRDEKDKVEESSSLCKVDSPVNETNQEVAADRQSSELQESSEMREVAVANKIASVDEPVKCSSEEPDSNVSYSKDDDCGSSQKENAVEVSCKVMESTPGVESVESKESMDVDEPERNDPESATKIESEQEVTGSSGESQCKRSESVITVSKREDVVHPVEMTTEESCIALSAVRTIQETAGKVESVEQTSKEVVLLEPENEQDKTHGEEFNNEEKEKLNLATEVASTKNDDGQGEKGGQSETNSGDDDTAKMVSADDENSEVIVAGKQGNDNNFDSEENFDGTEGTADNVCDTGDGKGDSDDKVLVTSEGMEKPLFESGSKIDDAEVDCKESTIEEPSKKCGNNSQPDSHAASQKIGSPELYSGKVDNCEESGTTNKINLAESNPTREITAEIENAVNTNAAEVDCAASKNAAEIESNLDDIATETKPSTENNSEEGEPISQKNLEVENVADNTPEIEPREGSSNKDLTAGEGKEDAVSSSKEPIQMEVEESNPENNSNCIANNPSDSGIEPGVTPMEVDNEEGDKTELNSLGDVETKVIDGSSEKQSVSLQVVAEIESNSERADSEMKDVVIAAISSERTPISKQESHRADAADQSEDLTTQGDNVQVSESGSRESRTEEEVKDEEVLKAAEDELKCAEETKSAEGEGGEMKHVTEELTSEQIKSNAEEIRMDSEQIKSTEETNPVVEEMNSSSEEQSTSKEGMKQDSSEGLKSSEETKSNEEQMEPVIEDESKCTEEIKPASTDVVEPSAVVTNSSEDITSAVDDLNSHEKETNCSAEEAKVTAEDAASTTDFSVNDPQPDVVKSDNVPSSVVDGESPAEDEIKDPPTETVKVVPEVASVEDSDVVEADAVAGAVEGAEVKVVTDADVGEVEVVAGSLVSAEEVELESTEPAVSSAASEDEKLIAVSATSAQEDEPVVPDVAQEEVMEVEDDDENKDYSEDFGMQGITILNVRSVTEEELLLPSLQDEDGGDKPEVVQIEDSDTKSQKDETEVEDDSVIADADNPSVLDSDNAEAENANKESPDADGSAAAEDKDKSAGASNKTKAAVLGKLCTVCDKTKSCKYQVLMQGMTKFVCTDECFREFGAKQKITNTIVSQFVNENRPVTRSVSNPRELCHICLKEIKNGMGLLAGVGEHKPLCSEDCMKKYQATQGLKRACAQCGGTIQGRNKCLTWETMEFCNEECLGKYQSFLGSNCACCHTSVQRTSLGKYCVRFGSDIKQFCSNKCLEEFKKVLKVCSFCQKDISRSSEAFIAPIGEKGQFKEFCSQTCMEKFETMGAVTPAQPSIQKCSVCSKMAQVKVEFVFEGKSHRLCSESCVAAFRYTNKINTSICDSCHKFFDLDVSHQLTIQFEGSCKRFCSKTCTNVFVLYRRKVVPCTWCKVKKYNFDMIERVDSNNHVQLFCSLNCLSLFRVSLNATSSKSVRCDFCRQLQPAQYHLTMSDASIRNFCSYNCVMQFQNQFTSITPVLPPQPLSQTTAETTIVSSASPRTTVAVSATTNSSDAGSCTTDSQQGTPVISSVVSLAPGLQQTVTTSSTTTTSTSTESPPSPGTTASVSPRLLVQSTCKPVMNTTASQTHVSQSLPINQRVLVKTPGPKLQKNKAIICKPMMQTKGVSCKPHPCHKSIQTETVQPLIIPVPIPIYIPVPMHMYTTPVPYPLPFPIPIPVPIFLHKPKDPADKNCLKFDATLDNSVTVGGESMIENERVPAITPVIVQETVSLPRDTKDVASPEAAKRVSEIMEMSVPSRRRPSRNSSKRQKLDVPPATLMEPDNRVQKDTVTPEVPVLTAKPANERVAAAIQLPELPKTFEDAIPKTVCNKTPKSTAMPIIHVATPQALTFPTASPEDVCKSSWDENGGLTFPRQLRARTRVQKRSSTRTGGRGRGRKKARIEMESSEGLSTEEDSSRGDVVAVDENSHMMVMTDANMLLKYTYGVNAWKYWVLQKNMQLEKASQTNRKLKLFKTELLQLTPDELNYSLCLFVKEVRKPNGEEYAPDSVYYLCLGIQQYLFENSRIDNIFTDTYFEKFTECLNEVLQRYEVSFNGEGLKLNRIDEEILWECKQLGAHSPHVLLNTLMFFNSKYFLLKTIDEHANLSFTQIMAHCKRFSRNSTDSDLARLGKVCSPLAAGSPFEHFENLENPLRCPVKLYEFYLSKCPESIKNRSDVFYLHPERACVPDSVVWYSTQALGRETVTKMLQRIKMVREITIASDL